MVKKRKKLSVNYKLGIIIVIFLFLFPLVAQVLVNFKSPFSNNAISNDWIGFLGGYFGAIIGGAITIFGVYLTLIHEREINRDNLTSNYKNMILSERPYLFIEPQINVEYPYDKANNKSNIDELIFNEGGLCLLLKISLSLSNDGKSSLYKSHITHQISPFGMDRLRSIDPPIREPVVRYYQIPSRLNPGDINKSDEICFVVEFPGYSAYGFHLRVDYVYYDIHETVYTNKLYYRVAIANLKDTTEPKVMVFLDKADEETITFRRF